MTRRESTLRLIRADLCSRANTSSRFGSTVVAITTVAIFAAGVAMFVVEAADLAAVEPQPLRFNQISCQNCAVWTSRTILSKPMLYRSRR